MDNRDLDAMTRYTNLIADAIGENHVTIERARTVLASAAERLARSQARRAQVPGPPESPNSN